MISNGGGREVDDDMAMMLRAFGASVVWILKPEVLSSDPSRRRLCEMMAHSSRPVTFLSISSGLTQI